MINRLMSGRREGKRGEMENQGRNQRPGAAIVGLSKALFMM